MAIFVSNKTPKGNIGTSNTSAELALVNEKALDDAGCKNCVNCKNCKNCTDCVGCSGCSSCRNCNNCGDCVDCEGCNRCIRCYHCVLCKICNCCNSCENCHNTYNCKRWNGPEANELLSLSGWYYNVATDGKHLQIGCQNHLVEDWKSFSADTLSEIDFAAPDMANEGRAVIEQIVALAAIMHLPPAEAPIGLRRSLAGMARDDSV